MAAQGYPHVKSSGEANGARYNLEHQSNYAQIQQWAEEHDRRTGLLNRQASETGPFTDLQIAKMMRFEHDTNGVDSNTLAKTLGPSWTGRRLRKKLGKDGGWSKEKEAAAEGGKVAKDATG